MKNFYANTTTFTEKFDACKKSWIRGGIFGGASGILIGFYCSAFKINGEFFAISAIMAVTCILVLTSFLATKYTAGFGLSCIPRAFEISVSDIGRTFRYGLIRAGLGATFLGIKMFLYVFTLFFFTFTFPLETVYYMIRASVEKNSDNAIMDVQMNMAV